jgi:hypothetical protein
MPPGLPVDDARGPDQNQIQAANEDPSGAHGRASPVAAVTGSTPQTGTGEKGFYEAYASFSRTLRGWLIAYGVGGPVLFATQPALGERLAQTGFAHEVTLMFMAGVAVQIFAALVYKTAMWYAYVGELEPAFQDTLRFRVASWLSDQFWLEMLFDLLTIGLFAAATACLVTALT